MTFRLRRRTAVVLTVAGVLVVVGVVLALSALPLLKARTEAKAAVTSVQAANADVQTHHFTAARADIARAREHVQAAQDSADGFGADVWAHVPVFGGAVTDARHLIEALDQATYVGDIGIKTYQDATGPHATLVRGDTVDLAQLRRLASLTSQIGPHLDAAQHELSAVDGDTPFVGAKFRSLRDDAASQLSGPRTSYDRFEPLFQQLPSILGAGQRRTYLIAILNPAEQRYSGGATLSMSTLHVVNGRIIFGHSYSVAQLNSGHPYLRWPQVTGNIFHRTGPTRLTAATFSPWWQVSGEELLRGWQARTGQHTDGLIAIDLQGLAGLFQLTGQVDVPGYGALTADNLVHTLAGSYDQYQNETVRHTLNEAIIPAFRTKLLSGGKFVEKGQSLLSSAEGRHFATYFRDPATERAAVSAGLAGNLSDTPHDYLGVFNQNLNGSKADYWQTRAVSSTVRLRPDGSSLNRMSLQVGNPAPAYTQPISDPRHGYLTRWLVSMFGVFLPQDSKLHSVVADGQQWHTHLRSPKVEGVYNRPMFRHIWSMAPDSMHTLTATYHVRSAAAVSANGDLTYELALDPQDLVDPQTNQVTLHIPDGYHFGTLPTGWSQQDDQTAVLPASRLTQSVTYVVPVLKD